MGIASWISPSTAQKRLDHLLLSMHASDRLTATRWLGGIAPAEHVPSSNVEAQALPFQRWYRFKEAFSPRFVSTAVGSLDQIPRVCADPFGGSGTTALTCQFLGVQPVTIEVNPFLADLIEAKLSEYELSALLRDYATVLKEVRVASIDLHKSLRSAPPTFVEPGVEGRWIFNRRIARRLLSYRQAIESLRNTTHQRLFRVLLGSIAVKLSNVVISGKGRRYRSSWQERQDLPASVDRAFQETAERAIQDISRFGRRAERSYTLLRGDARELVRNCPPAEFALFSPPYASLLLDYTSIEVFRGRTFCKQTAKLSLAFLDGTPQIFNFFVARQLSEAELAQLGAKRSQLYALFFPTFDKLLVLFLDFLDVPDSGVHRISQLIYLCF